MGDKIDLLGLSNILVDLVFPVSHDEAEHLGIINGTFDKKKEGSVEYLEQLLKEKEPVTKYFCGGSPANTIFSADTLGLKTSLMGTVGNDAIGQKYMQRLKDSNIASYVVERSGPTGICCVPVMPDGEKSAITKMGVSNQFTLYKIFDEFKVFHTSTYELMSDSEKFIDFIEWASKEKKAKISLDLGAAKIVNKKNSEIINIVAKYVDILFMTEEEATALTDMSSEASFRMLTREVCPIVVLKKGKNGSVVGNEHSRYNIPIYPVPLVNTNGAGDSYAAGFLFGYIKGLSLEECGHMGTYIASRVCAREESSF